MSRTLNSPVTDQRGELVYLYEITHSGGTIRVTNSSADITTTSPSATWTAIGGALLHGSPVEVGDRKAQGVELRLYGVNQQIISAIQNNQFRGYMAKVYLLHYNPDTGVANTPDLLFQGRQNSDYKVTESRDHTSTDSGGTVTVSTRITGDVALMNRKVSTRANVPSHQDMLRRKSLTATDTFFSRVASLAGKDIYWGTGEPMRARNTPAGFSDPNDSELQQLGWS